MASVIFFVQKIVQFFSPSRFIWLTSSTIMMIKCILCGQGLEDDEENVCKTCLEVLRKKYPNKKELDVIILWHKNHTKKLNQDG